MSKAKDFLAYTNPIGWVVGIGVLVGAVIYRLTKNIVGDVKYIVEDEI